MRYTIRTFDYKEVAVENTLQFRMELSSTTTLVAPHSDSPEQLYLDLVEEAQKLLPDAHFELSRACRAPNRVQSVIDVFSRWEHNGVQRAHLKKLEEFKTRYGS